MIKKQIETAVTSDVGSQLLSWAEKEFRAKHSSARENIYVACKLKIHSKRRFQQAS